ncbi:MAG: dihydroorotate dehydrogenase-like protein [Candidatus Omnitrophica bacterium]|nr:dihydroorotate dehydrogenase-like protein [Candidatus Omnitrophota bacterium]
MDLTTYYMGLRLKNPLVVSASPLSHHIENYPRMEAAGIAAIVTSSIFQEYIEQENFFDPDQFSVLGADKLAESMVFSTEKSGYPLGPREYLEHIRLAKKSVEIPVIASLNGRTAESWVSYAKRVEEAGADAIELNIYFIPTDTGKTGGQIEEVYIDLVQGVRAAVKIPLAVKVGPYFSNMANMAKRFEQAGANALVLFNRFYQPDIDVATMTVVPNLMLSTAYDARLSLRWIAILHGKLKMSLAATSGIHHAQDVIKLLLAGADATMLCSVLLKEGIEHAAVILKGVYQWMQDNGYKSVDQIKGKLSQKSCGSPSVFERVNYMKMLKSFPG